MIPFLVLFYVTLFILTRYIRHDEELKEAFFTYKWNGRWLQRFAELEKEEYWPDIELGPDSVTKEMVVMPGKDRTLNTAIIGAIGTGKTSALGLPIINQDLHHMVRYIQEFPDIYQREDFETEDVGGRYMNGISIIEPSNDLCMKALQLVKAHGIPDEAITYIDPTNPNTPSINPMQGPVDKVAEVFAQVIAGLNDSKGGGNFYFEQAQRNHLKHYIYLLKLHDEEKQVTLDMLLDMYNNPQLVREMHVKLKGTFPEDYESIVDRDERNYWKIVQGIDEWFDLNLLPKMVRVGGGEVAERNKDGEIVYFDALSEHVRGLRNILNDIGANPLIRRVLFGESEFDFDRHMAIGGILLVNTAKGELVDLARVLGKIVLMNLQNATFRRKPNISPFHHIVVDEAPDYLYNAFREFPAQSRKYKVTVTILMQTVAQLADHFGELYMTTLIAGMRNRMVYGDVPSYDAKYFSDMFGEKTMYSEGQSEMAVSPLQEDPMSRSGSSYQKVREASMSSADVMFQEAFQCAVKIVVNNKPMPVVQIDANFVPYEEFEVAKQVVEEEELKVWLHERSLYGTKKQVDQPIVSVEETEVENAEFYNDKQVANVNENPELNEEIVDKVVNIPLTPRPRKEVTYHASTSSNHVLDNEEKAAVAVKAPLNVSTYDEPSRETQSLNNSLDDFIQVYDEKDKPLNDMGESATAAAEVEEKTELNHFITEWNEEEPKDVPKDDSIYRGEYKISEVDSEEILDQLDIFSENK